MDFKTSMPFSDNLKYLFFPLFESKSKTKFFESISQHFELLHFSKLLIIQIILLDLRADFSQSQQSNVPHST